MFHAHTSILLGFLAHSFNCMMDELSNLVVRVKVATDEMEILTRTTQLRMTQLVSVSSHQIQNMLEAVMAVEHMADTAFTIAEQSQVLAKIARETHHAMQSGRDAAAGACLSGCGRGERPIRYGHAQHGRHAARRRRPGGAPLSGLAARSGAPRPRSGDAGTISGAAARMNLTYDHFGRA